MATTTSSISFFFMECDFGFGLVIGFIGLFDTTHDYILLFTDTHTHTHTHKHTNTQTHTHTHVTSTLLVLGSGFQRRTFPFLWVPELSPCHCYQLPTATAHNDGTSAVL
jgi:hypothetical protein